MKHNEYHIATSVDDRYFVPMYVMLFSLFENNKGHHYNIHILYSDITDEQRQAVEILVANYSGTVYWYLMNNNETSRYYTSGYITDAAYYRIYLPDLVPPQVEKLLYLDADMIIRGKLDELLSTRLDGIALCAVKEAIPYKISRLGIPTEYDYFNSGVLYLNMTEWRSNEYSMLLRNNIEREKTNYLMHDQDALNALFYNRTSYLHPKWNHQTGFYHLNEDQLQTRYGLDKKTILDKPVIVHFVGWRKPWQYLCTHPYKSVFLQYLSKTPFNDFVEKGNFYLFSQKIALRAKHKLQKIF